MRKYFYFLFKVSMREGILCRMPRFVWEASSTNPMRIPNDRPIEYRACDECDNSMGYVGSALEKLMRYWTTGRRQERKARLTHLGLPNQRTRPPGQYYHHDAFLLDCHVVPMLQTQQTAPHSWPQTSYTHSSIWPRPRTVVTRAMFGSSEDRARQLAGRQRWRRIASSESQSSYPSASSSSQQPSQNQPMDITGRAIQRSATIAEHRNPYNTFTQGSQRSHGQMYPGQSLHNNNPNRNLPPQQATSSWRYGVLEPRPIPSQSRNITDVGSHLRTMGCSSTTPISQMGPTLPHIHQSLFGPYQPSQIPISLGGGAPGIQQSQVPGVLPARAINPAWDSYRTQVEWDGIHLNFPWMPPDPAHPAWSIPISSGEWYQYFLASLDRQQFEAFCCYFGQNWGANTPGAALSRKTFYQSLYPYPQNAFRRIIDECRSIVPDYMGFRGASSIISPPLLEGPLAAPLHSQPRPVITIYHMISATIPMPMAPPGLLPPPDRSRSTSAPQLVLRQDSQVPG
jgi:hypothetical protein